MPKAFAKFKWFVPILLLGLLGTIFLVIENNNKGKIIETGYFSNYKYQISTNTYTSFFNKKDSSTPVVNFGVKGSSIELTLSEPDYEIVTVDQSKIEYKKGDTRIVYTTTKNGIKEEIILSTKEENALIKYSFTLKNNSMRMVNEIPYFYDNRGKYVFHFSTPFAIDSKGIRTDDVEYKIEEKPNGEYTLSTVVNSKWLNDPKRSYPVIIDPTIIHTPPDEPLDGATGVNIPVAFTVTGTDTEGDYLRYKIEVCENRDLTIGCQTFDQTGSQTGWSGQNTQSNTAYTSGTTGTYTSSSFAYGKTYYWRSYAIDPGGSNTWSTAETTPRSFTTNAYTRPSTSSAVSIFSARRISEFVSTTQNWANITGDADSGTTASSNGWISSSNFTPGKKYLILVTGSHSTDSTSGKSGLKVKHGTTSFENSESVDKTYNSTATYKTPYFWFTVWTAVVSESIEVQLYWNGVGSQARAEDITLLALDVNTLITNGDLQYSENKTYTTIDSTFADLASLTFTPTNNNDDWWIMGYNQTSLIYDTDETAFINQLYINSTAYSNNYVSVGSNSISPIFPLGYVKQLPNSSNSVSIQAKRSGLNQIVQASGIFALRLNIFEDYYITTIETGPSMSSLGNWVNHFTSYPYNSLNNSNWVVLAGASVNDNGARVQGRIQQGGTSITDDLGGWQKFAGDKTPLILSDYLTGLTSGSKTFTFDAQTTNSGTATMNYPWLVAFSREILPNYPTQDSPTNANPSVPIRPQLKITAIDPEISYLRYKIQYCTDFAMTQNCVTADSTTSQTGWSGQNAQSYTAYMSGSQATYTPQSDLTPNLTYYWRSFSIDPAGTNTFTSINTTPYSFVVTTAPTAPTALLTEGSTNPTGITDTSPEFSAIHNDPEGDASASYQIQVNTQADFLGTSMWDSGKTSLVVTEGERSADISYSGAKLGFIGTKYYWRMKFWDSNDSAGAWSTTADFTTKDLEYASSCYLIQTKDDSSITLNWKDNSTLEDGFKIQRKVDAGSFTDLITKAANTITHTDSTITQGHTYQYRIAPTYDAIDGTWCTTDVASVFSGSIKFEGLQLGGIKID